MRYKKLFIAMLLACAPATAGAQTLADYDYENLTFRGIGLDYGFIWPSKVASTPAYTIRLDLGFLGPGVRVAPHLTYWSSDMRNTELDRLADQINRLPPLQQQGVTLTAADLGNITWSDLSIGIDTHLMWTTPIGLLTYVGAGAAIHALNGHGEFIESTFVEDLLDSTAAGVAVMAGLEYQVLPRLRLYGEARYTLVTDIRYPGLRVGASLMLPPRAASAQSN
jgi:Outer membrane protein beta-barrel domain